MAMREAHRLINPSIHDRFLNRFSIGSQHSTTRLLWAYTLSEKQDGVDVFKKLLLQIIPYEVS